MPNHLKVLLGQALEFLLQLLDSLGQIIVPLIQQLVFVQQGLALLFRLSNSLQLTRRELNKDTLKDDFKSSSRRKKEIF